MRVSRIALALVLSTGAGAFACSLDSNSSAPAQGESVGSLSAALSAVGPDGATYSLPQGSWITVNGPLDTGYSASGTGVQTWSLPAGTYTVTLAPPPSVSTATGWPLTRSADAGATTATAKLLDTMPITLTVTAGQTTSLAFHFQLENLGTVTFSTGTVDTSIQFEAGTTATPPASGTLTGTMTENAFPQNNPGTNTAVDTLLTLTTPLVVPYSFTFTFNGAFAAGADQVCAPVTITTASSTTTNAAYVAWVAELVGASGSLCINDATNTGDLSGPNGVTLSVGRSGAPLTAPFTTALTTDAGVLTAYFDIILRLTSPTTLYNGTSLSLGPLAQPTAMATAPYATFLFIEPSNVDVGTEGSSQPTGTLTLTP